MTTTVTTAQTGPLTANGVAPLPFAFQAISASEVGVTRNGVTQIGGYTVTLNADGTGSVIPSSSWNADSVFIFSAPNYQQPTAFNKFGAWYPDQINLPLDRLNRQIIALRSAVETTAAGGTPLGNDTLFTASAQQYGAVGDGVVDDYANLLIALQSGNAIDGLGRTYALSAELVPATFKGLRNATLKWLNTTAMGQQKALLKLYDLSDWYVDRVKFDLGTVENTGSLDDSTRNGLSVGTNGSSLLRPNQNIQVTNCTVTGNGNGTGLNIRNVNKGLVSGNLVRDRLVAFSPDPTNDAQNGIDITNSADMTVSDNVISNLHTRLGGVDTRRFSRGIVITSTADSSFTGNIISDVDQAFDFSGGTSIEGNRGIVVVGNKVSDVRTWGYKFANAARDFVVSGNMARRFGLGGYVFTGLSSGTDFSLGTQRILVVGNYAMDPTGESSPGGCVGFRISPGGAVGGESYPRGIHLKSNVVSDVSGGGHLSHGYFNEVIYGGGQFNDMVDCQSFGHINTMQTGIHRPYCKVSGVDQSIPNSVSTVINWTAESEDTVSMHEGAVAARITAKVAGWYRAKAVVRYAANAAGFRSLGLRVNDLFTGVTSALNAINGSVTFVALEEMVSLAVGDYVDIVTEQNSGGALVANLANSYFELEFVRER